MLPCVREKLKDKIYSKMNYFSVFKNAYVQLRR